MARRERVMKQIILTEDQARQIAEATEVVELRDSAGTLLVKVDPFDARALADHRRRRQEGKKLNGVSGSVVRAHLEALQAEWDRTGGFDQAYMETFLTSLRSARK